MRTKRCCHFVHYLKGTALFLIQLNLSEYLTSVKCYLSMKKFCKTSELRVEHARSRVAVVVATFRRPDELARLLKCLRQCERVALVSICDNESSERTRQVVADERGIARYPVLYDSAPSNRGCGAGLNRAIDSALAHDCDITHFWICDDDIVFDGCVLSDLLKAIQSSGVGSAAPAITSHTGHVVAAPCLLNPEDSAKCQLGLLPEVFKSNFCSLRPIPFTVCQGTCHLVTAQALRLAGRIREDFWMLGEDLDLSNRIVHLSGGVFVPSAFVAHLYGAPLDPASAPRSNYLKQLALMQNYTYMGYHTTHGKHMRGRYFDLLRGRGLARQYISFLNRFGWRPFAVFDLLQVIWAAWILGQPAGGKIGFRIRSKRFAQDPSYFRGLSTQS